MKRDGNFISFFGSLDSSSGFSFSLVFSSIFVSDGKFVLAFLKLKSEYALSSKDTELTRFVICEGSI